MKNIIPYNICFEIKRQIKIITVNYFILKSKYFLYRFKRYQNKYNHFSICEREIQRVNKNMASLNNYLQELKEQRNI